MEIDWGFAGIVGGVGCGGVFAVLVILALAIWLMGLIIRKFVSGKSEPGPGKRPS